MEAPSEGGAAGNVRPASDESV